MPDDMRNEFIKPLYEPIVDSLRLGNWSVDSNIIIHKVGHVLGFSFLSCFLFLFRQKNKSSIVCLLCFVLLFAISTEAIQLYRHGREARVIDVFFDMLGVGIGFLVYYAFSNLTLRNSHPK